MRNKLPLPAFPLDSLVADTPTSIGSTSSPKSPLAHRQAEIPSSLVPSFFPESSPSEIFPSFPPLVSDRTRTVISDLRHRCDPSGNHVLISTATPPPRPPRSAESPMHDLSPSSLSRRITSAPRAWASRGVASELSTFDANLGEGGASSSRPRDSGSPRFQTRGSTASASISASSPHLHPPNRIASASSPSMRPPASPLPRRLILGSSYPGATLPALDADSVTFPGNLFGTLDLTPTELASSPATHRPASPQRHTGEPISSPQSSSRSFSGGTTRLGLIPEVASNSQLSRGNATLSVGDGGSPSWGVRGPEGRVSAEDYAQVGIFLPPLADLPQALTVYEHILSAVPYIGTQSFLSPSTSSLGKGRSQPFDSLIQLAQEGIRIISGQTSAPGSRTADESKPGFPTAPTKRTTVSTSMGDNVFGMRGD